MYLWQSTSPSNLGFYRPNQAMNRVYGSSFPSLSGMGAPGVFAVDQLQSRMAGLGDDIPVNPQLLIAGVGLLAAGMFLFGAKKGPVLRKHKAARLRRRLKQLEEG